MSFFDEIEGDISRLDRGRFDLITSLHDRLACDDNRLPPDFDRFVPSVMLCKFEREPEYAPEILTIGSRSIQRDIFGNRWANQILTVKRTPDVKMESRSAIAYEQAYREGFSLHLTEGIVMTDFGPRLTAYARYITTVRMGNDARLYCVAGVLQDLQIQ